MAAATSENSDIAFRGPPWKTVRARARANRVGKLRAESFTNYGYRIIYEFCLQIIRFTIFGFTPDIIYDTMHQWATSMTSSIMTAASRPT